MKSGKKTAVLILLMIMIVTMMPAVAFAENEDTEDLTSAAELVEGKEYDESEAGYEEFTLGMGIDGEIRGADPEQLMNNFLYSEDASAGKSLFSKMTPKTPLSVKGDRLTDNNLKYYNYYKNIIKDVDAGKRTDTSIRVSLSKFLGKRKFTAKGLGVKRIGYVRNGRWYVTSEAQKKIQKLLMPEDWKKVYQGVLSDMSSESYWVDWYSNAKFFNWNCPYRYNTNTVIFETGDWIEFGLPVMPEFALSGYSTNYYIYKADRNKINGAISAKNRARTIVAAFDNMIPSTFAGYSPEAIDFYRLLFYCKMISDLNTYDDYSASLSDAERYWRGPWSMIYVFDDSTSTNAVCAGYARALKYLCDLSDFNSDWIDCQIVSGTAGSTNINHMWNIVRMNDGLNYIIDPTWMDDDVNSDIDARWFLRGAPGGTVNAYTIDGISRIYDDWTKASYAPAERKLSSKDWYEFTSDRPIVLKKTKISRISGKKKSFDVKWKKVTSPLGALYVDGYQIQYSTKKNFKSARTVQVKGYANAAATIKKLKSRKTYYVRVRTYAKAGKRTYYSAWSARKKVRTR